MPVEEYIPDINIDVGSITGIITWGLFLLILGVIAGFIIYYILVISRYNKKVLVLGKVGNRVEIIGEDKGMEMKLGRTGDTIFHLRKYKKYLPRPKIQVGRKLYWYFIREDGEWINIGIGNIDEQMRQAGVEYVDEDMRYARDSLLKFMKESYDKPSFLEKYGGLIAYSGLILVTAVGFWFIIDKMMDIVTQFGQQIELANDLSVTQNEILKSLDNICSGGSGLRPA